MTDLVKVSALLLGSALLMFAGGLHGLLTAIRGGQEGFSLVALGLIGTSWSVGFVAGTILVPQLVSRVGHVRSFSVMASVASIVILVNVMFVEQYSWILLRAVSGFCFAGAAMVVESWLNEVTTNQRRGTVFAAYMMANLAAATAGQLVLAWVGVAGFMAFVLGAAAYSLAVLPTALSLSPQPRPLVRASLDLGLLWRTSPIALVAAFAVGVTGGAFGTLAPVYGVIVGLSSETVVYLMSLSIVAGAVTQLPFGRASDRMDRRIVVMATSLLAAAAGVLMVLLDPGEGWVIYGLFGLYGLAANSIYPVAVAHANDHVRDGNFATVAAGLLLLFGIGLALGPLFASAAMTILGPVYLFMVTAAVHAGLAGAAYLRMQIRPKPRPEARAPFQLVPAGRDS
ncbi:MAG: MFS transporter, partial [Cucumibacter sp.]